ncbi:hypothetical protein IQ781_06255 [Bacillus sp. N447-1]|nr:hypothetical protein [Bacillus sp. N447-1]UNT70188.1 hypothetical protein IQ781_06255 [Bacillus sp. N447-1]HDR4425384.1 hypothetical protein [Bacillus cereus]
MIKLNLNNQIDIEELLLQHKEKYSMEYMKKRFEEYETEIYDEDLSSEYSGDLLQKKKDKHSRFIKYLMLKTPDILCGEPMVLQKIIEHVETNYSDLLYSAPESNQEPASPLHKGLKKIFSYDNFCKRDKSWGAYALTERLNVKVCPYCNRQYVHTLKMENGKMRASLDHFYDKGTYPFLSISFYNLIPCCHLCNSSLKGRKRFNINTHLHPYIEGFDQKASFTVKFKKEVVDFTGILNNNSDVFDIGFRVEKGKGSNKSYQKAKRNIRDFNLNEIYNLHKDYVAEILLKSVIYNEDFVNSIYSSYPHLFTGKEEILRLITSNYVSADELDKRVLAKLTYDIASEFGLIYKL